MSKPLVIYFNDENFGTPLPKSGTFSARIKNLAKENSVQVRSIDEFSTVLNYLPDYTEIYVIIHIMASYHAENLNEDYPGKEWAISIHDRYPNCNYYFVTSDNSSITQIIYNNQVAENINNFMSELFIDKRKNILPQTVYEVTLRQRQNKQEKQLLTPYDFKNHFAHQFLHEILKNTKKILTLTNTSITNETSVYKSIENYLTPAFSSIRRRNSARFIEAFKTYKPDILIPEIYAAIEYKKIEGDDNVGTFIEQLKTDSENYSGDPLYRVFYAVCFFNNESTWENKFLAAWSEAKFPINWIPIIA